MDAQVREPSSPPLEPGFRIFHFASVTQALDHIRGLGCSAELGHDADGHLVLHYQRHGELHTVAVIHLDGEGAYLVKLPVA